MKILPISCLFVLLTLLYSPSLNAQQNNLDGKIYLNQKDIVLRFERLGKSFLNVNRMEKLSAKPPVKINTGLGNQMVLDSTCIITFTSPNDSSETTKYVYTYNANGFDTATTEIDYDQSTLQMTPAIKLVYSYNASNLDTLIASYEWNTSVNQWSEVTKTSYAYTIYGLDSVEKYVNFDTAVIPEYYPYSDKITTYYYYNAANLDTLKSIYYMGGSPSYLWMNIYQYRFSYNLAGQNTLERVYENLSSQWESIDSIVNGYNSNGFDTLSISYAYLSSQWQPDLYSANVFNTNGLVTVDSSYSWNSAYNEMTNISKNTYTYNAQGLLTCITNYIGDTTSWNINTKQYYYYSQTGNTTNIPLRKIVGVSMYPNPVKDMVTISLTNTESNAQIFVYTMEGKEVYKGIMQSSNADINMSAYPKGIYLVKVITADQQMVTQKMVKL